MTDTSVRLLKGTVDLMILKTLAAGPLHGYAISRWLATTTGDVFRVQEGALYPALRRLEAKGLVSSRWAPTRSGREARWYVLTDDGRARLGSELREWSRYVAAMNRVLAADVPAGTVPE
jgi:PadR family transcriptional regulator PadR